MAGEYRDQMAAEERARTVGWEHAVRAITGCSIEDARRLYKTPRALQDWLSEDRRARYEAARAQRRWPRRRTPAPAHTERPTTPG